MFVNLPSVMIQPELVLVTVTFALEFGTRNMPVEMPMLTFVALARFQTMCRAKSSMKSLWGLPLLTGVSDLSLSVQASRSLRT